MSKKDFWWDHTILSVWIWRSAQGATSRERSANGAAPAAQGHEDDDANRDDSEGQRVPAVEVEGEGLGVVRVGLQPGCCVVGRVAAGSRQAAATTRVAGTGERLGGARVGRSHGLDLNRVAGLVVVGREGDHERLPVRVDLVERAQVGRVVGDGQADLLGVAAARVEHQEVARRRHLHLDRLGRRDQAGHTQHELGLEQRRGSGVVTEDVLRVRGWDHEAGAGGLGRALGRRGRGEHGQKQSQCRKGTDDYTQLAHKKPPLLFLC